MRILLSDSEDAIFIVDEYDNLVFHNRAARLMFSIPAESSAPARSVIDHETIHYLLQLEQSQRVELTFDEERVYSLQMTVIAGQGRTFVMQDITYLKEADRLKSDFIVNVSQDLRSPLTAILGYVELLDRAGPLTEQQQMFIERISFSAQSISALITDLLDLTHIEDSDPERSRDVVMLDQILTYALATVEGQIQAKQHQFSMEAADGLPSVYGNGQRLKQMTRNLLQNALLYTPDGGRITVRLWSEFEMVILQIEDSGTGIPLEDQPHIFDKFYRAENVRQLHNGAGLGLAIVKSIVDRHNGRIWVDSQVGQGSIFTIVLPAHTP